MHITYDLWRMMMTETLSKIIWKGDKLESGPSIITIDMVRDHKGDKPLDTAAYKTKFSAYNIAQRLFKEEIGKYDKKHHDISDLRSIDTRTKLVRSWYNTLYQYEGVTLLMR
jgi:hypothetical protein